MSTVLVLTKKSGFVIFVRQHVVIEGFFVALPPESPFSIDGPPAASG